MAVAAASSEPPFASRSLAWRGMRWALPVLVVLLLAAATFALFALSSTQERSIVRDQLVADTVWVRESLRFQLDHEVETLQLVASDIVQSPLNAAAAQARLRVYLRRAREVVAADLVDPQLAPVVQVDRGPGADYLGQIPPALAEAAAARAQQSGRPYFTVAFAAPWGAALSVFVPVPAPPSARGALPRGGYIVCTYALDRLLEEMVPWTFAQENEITLSNVSGTVKARRASAGRGRNVYTHQEPLDLAGTTLVLGANSVKGPPDWIANALRGGIAALAAILLWSLWALWRDVQKRVAAEHGLREEAAFRRAMGDSAVIGLRARDMSGRIIYVNPAFTRIVGYTEDELVGRNPPMPYWVPELADEYQRRTSAVLAGRAGEAPFETTFRRRDGTRVPVMIYDAPLRDADGVQRGWMSSVIDLTEQKHAEERERQREERLQTAARLTTMGEMASSLAHELNQPLAAITSYLTGSVNLLQAQAGATDEVRAALAKAAAQAQRAGHVIRRVHEFVRKREPQRTEVDVRALLEDCRPLIELQGRREGVRASIEVAPGLAPVHGDPVMLQQVVLNLTRNAIEAMAGVPPERRRLEIAAVRADEGVRIAVRDHGAGIPPEAAERMFSPFFTTKPEGMGMGLSICRSIAEAHGGRLWFEPRTPGVEFVLQLPAVP